ncbi:hypothetical protein GGP87_001040 [Salinibacter ruber]|nr:hypothetical protein [Salinibacter ruber]
MDLSGDWLRELKEQRKGTWSVKVLGNLGE